MPQGFVSALPSRYDVAARCPRAEEILENAPTLLRGGGGFGGRINHAAGARLARPRARTRFVSIVRSASELISHPNTANTSRAGLPPFRLLRHSDAALRGVYVKSLACPRCKFDRISPLVIEPLESRGSPASVTGEPLRAFLGSGLRASSPQRSLLA